MPRGIYPKEKRKGLFQKGHKGYTYWRGRNFSEEHRRKLSKANKGKKLSAKTKKAMSKARKGKIGYWKDKILSKETKEKMSVAHKGRKPTEEAIEKEKRTKREYWDRIGRKEPRPFQHQGWQYNEWRKAIFEYDNYICWICEERGGDLNAHHLKEFSKFPKLRYVVVNGITLCEKCHQLYG